MSTQQPPLLLPPTGISIWFFRSWRGEVPGFIILERGASCGRWSCTRTWTIPALACVGEWHGRDLQDMSKAHSTELSEVMSETMSKVWNPAQPRQTAAGPQRAGASIRKKVQSTRDIEQRLKGLITKCLWNTLCWSPEINGRRLPGLQLFTGRFRGRKIATVKQML